MIEADELEELFKEMGFETNINNLPDEDLTEEDIMDLLK